MCDARHLDARNSSPPLQKQHTLWEEAMPTVNHIITAGILVFLMAFSPMSISLLQDSGPRVATISYTAN